MGAPSPFERQQGRIDKNPSARQIIKSGLAAAGVIFAPLALADCTPAFGSEPKSYVSRAAPPDTPTPGGIQSIRIGDGGTITVNYFPTANSRAVCSTTPRSKRSSSNRGSFSNQTSRTHSSCTNSKTN